MRNFCFTLALLVSLPAVASDGSAMKKAMELRNAFAAATPITQEVYSQINSKKIWSCSAQRTDVPYGFETFPAYDLGSYRKFEVVDGALTSKSFGQDVMVLVGIKQVAHETKYESQTVTEGSFVEGEIDGDLTLASKNDRSRARLDVVRVSGDKLIVESQEFVGFSNGPNSTNPIRSSVFPQGYVVSSYELCI